MTPSNIPSFESAIGCERFRYALRSADPSAASKDESMKACQSSLKEIASSCQGVWSALGFDLGSKERGSA